MPSSRRRDIGPSASEFGMLRAYLARQGVSQATIKEVVGTGPQGRTRTEITAELTAWLKTRPKA